MQRRVIIDLLDKAIQRGSDGKFAREDMIHEIIVPMRITSDDQKFRRNSLWLVDERLAFHDVSASDRPIRSMPISSCESTKEPDIVSLRTFNNPLAVSENDTGPQASITVVEIKRPMRNDSRRVLRKTTSSDTAGASVLLGGYAKAPQRKLADRFQMRITISGFVYVVADLTKKLQDRCEFHQLKSNADGMGYFGYHQSASYNAYIQVTSFEGLVASAKERNRAFFDKLGLPTH